MRAIISPIIAVAVFMGGMNIGGNPVNAAEPGDKVTVTIDRWRAAGSNNIGTADVTISNDNDFAVKDVRVKCEYMSKVGGRKIETEQNIPVTVKAKSKKTFKKTKFAYIDTGAAEGSCKVRSATQI